MTWSEKRPSWRHAFPPGNRNANPPDIGFFELVLEDARTHDGDLLAGGFWALFVHRFGNMRMGFPRVFRPPLTLLYRCGYHLAIALFGIDLPYNARLGRRIRFVHNGPVFVGVWSMGDDVTFRHSATIGLARRGATDAPTIGSRVEIGAGACIVGGIRVGDDTFIGPNTVLADDLPDGCAVLGNPARRVKLADLGVG